MVTTGQRRIAAKERKERKKNEEESIYARWDRGESLRRLTVWQQLDPLQINSLLKSYNSFSLCSLSSFAAIRLWPVHPGKPFNSLQYRSSCHALQKMKKSHGLSTETSILIVGVAAPGDSVSPMACYNLRAERFRRRSDLMANHASALLRPKRFW